MAVLEWSKSFELGIEQFDEHHKHLVGLLNKAYGNFTGGAGREPVGAILAELVDYATYHFAAEEQWMDAHNYSGLPHHCDEHATFSKRVLEIQKNFHGGKTNLSLEILNVVQNWLFDHILKTDADYAKLAGNSQGEPQS
jgi:hemerythrin